MLLAMGFYAACPAIYIYSTYGIVYNATLEKKGIGDHSPIRILDEYLPLASHTLRNEVGDGNFLKQFDVCMYVSVFVCIISSSALDG